MTTNLTGSQRGRAVQQMFARIAPNYDLMNRLMTGGQDIRWRREVVELAGLEPGQSLLDLGCGTGDLAREALRRQPLARVLAADFTLEMMLARQKRSGPAWSAADALALPFENESFDAVVSGFLMRNVADLQTAIREQYRVLKSGGRIVILDTTQPKPNLLSPLIRVHMHLVIPTLGRLISGNPDAYRYLPDSTEQFVTAEELAARLAAAGFKHISFHRRAFGTIAIHRAHKTQGHSAAAPL
ncbi:MAG: ubiquinone/menaquinone biosynthesis methyltransferase [Anaerolineales bacterium]|nr:ubiquinone/menaquinone biosynthesis methyltransferase [Anaerolineales bacterium]